MCSLSLCLSVCLLSLSLFHISYSFENFRKSQLPCSNEPNIRHLSRETFRRNFKINIQLPCAYEQPQGFLSMVWTLGRGGESECQDTHNNTSLARIEFRKSCLLHTERSAGKKFVRSIATNTYLCCRG